MRGEVDAFATSDCTDGDNVPNVVRNHPGGQKIYVARGEAAFARASGGGDLEDVALAAGDGADLDAEKARAGINYIVVSGGIAEWLADDQPELEGASGKADLCPFALEFEASRRSHVGQFFELEIPRGEAARDFGARLRRRTSASTSAHSPSTPSRAKTARAGDPLEFEASRGGHEWSVRVRSKKQRRCPSARKQRSLGMTEL